MTLEAQFVAVLQLLLAALLGGLIGLDRERKQHDAGLRTHMLVCMGACLFTVLSLWRFPAAIRGGSPRKSCRGSAFSARGRSSSTGATFTA